MSSQSDQSKSSEFATELHAAIWNRLALMPAVAQHKFHQKKPISDRIREADVIQQFRNQAMFRGIHPDFAEAVMRAQIDAARLTQEQLHSEWERDPPPEDAQLRDLVRDLRPSIDETNERMLVALQLLGGVPLECQRALEEAYLRRSPLPPHVPTEAWELAWVPLRSVPPNFMPGRAALGKIPTSRSLLPENQPLLPDFAPE